jgi:hypothetical protein
MEIHVTYANEGFKSQIEYSFRLLCTLLDLSPTFCKGDEIEARALQQNGLVISYGPVKPDIAKVPHIHIYESEFWSKGYLTEHSLPRRPVARYRDLPVLYAVQGEGQGFVKEENRGAELFIDIVASVFFLVTQYEAAVLRERDQHGRFPASASLAVHENLLHRPLVHEYAELLWLLVRRIAPKASRRSWLHDADFAVLVGHDVDMFWKYSVRSLLSCLFRKGGNQRARREGLREFYSQFMRVRIRGQQDPYQSFDYLHAREEQAGCRASFYFRAGRGSSYDGPTHLRSRALRFVLSTIQAREDEIALHGSYHSAFSPGKLRREKARLERLARQPIVGNRFHYLRFRIPETWRYLAEAGFQYDATLGFGEHEGFRCGLCLPFRPYDLLENREIPIWEIPLLVMDTTLRFYRGLSAEQAFETIVNLMETAKRFHGVFVIVWHNSSFDEQLWPGWKKVFENFLDRLRSERAFCGTGAEVIRMWNEHVETLGSVPTGD